MTTRHRAAACLLCDPTAADAAFDRARIWERDGWRLSVVLRGPVAGFAHLEPVRHIPSIADLDGPEAATFGPALAAATALLRDATGAERTYGYLFGERVAHLHVNLAPVHPGGPLRGGPGMVDPAAAALEEVVHRAVLATVLEAARARG
ncbi:hypothetical protein [Nakamurella leprariae]|uniref:HIT family protein n=1 Tax=Nakamurella leprariae TaxID=2803911 RepID=A0A938YFU5_9ACTN|nr:hypothetical protein [Nakamurella leprariae]MBM9467369.1 hypothetical protein [Nakamurella leprariae]